MKQEETEIGTAEIGTTEIGKQKTENLLIR